MLNRPKSNSNVIDRLKNHFGTYQKACFALGVGDQYSTRWRRMGYIPESYALDIEELRVVDRHGPLTAYDVLKEARDVRRAKIAAAEAEQ